MMVTAEVASMSGLNAVAGIERVNITAVVDIWLIVPDRFVAKVPDALGYAVSDSVYVIILGIVAGNSSESEVFAGMAGLELSTGVVTNTEVIMLEGSGSLAGGMGFLVVEAFKADLPAAEYASELEAALSRLAGTPYVRDVVVPGATVFTTLVDDAKSLLLAVPAVIFSVINVVPTNEVNVVVSPVANIATDEVPRTFVGIATEEIAAILVVATANEVLKALVDMTVEEVARILVIAAVDKVSRTFKDVSARGVFTRLAGGAETSPASLTSGDE